jgi:hypothetical protein
MTMKANLSKASVKRQAKLLAQFLQEDGIPIQHSRALEAMARCHGFRDWRTADAALPDDATEATAPVVQHPTDSDSMIVPEASRTEAALVLFSPELARIVARQIHMLDRAIANFVCASVGHPPPSDHWTTFKPSKPSLYPGVAEFRDLGTKDAALLVEFYDTVNEIEDIVTQLRESETVWDVNVWNGLMQRVQHSVSMGVVAVERFCPSRQNNTSMPAAGTLTERASKSTANMQSALVAHIDRFNARAAANAPQAAGAHRARGGGRGFGVR